MIIVYVVWALPVVMIMWALIRVPRCTARSPFTNTQCRLRRGHSSDLHYCDISSGPHSTRTFAWRSDDATKL